MVTSMTSDSNPPLAGREGAQLDQAPAPGFQFLFSPGYHIGGFHKSSIAASFLLVLCTCIHRDAAVSLGYILRKRHSRQLSRN